MAESVDVAPVQDIQTQEDGERARRRQSRGAIALAMDGRWREAAALNRKLLALAPEGLEAWNRLGKALLELGEYAEAQEAFEHALALSSDNVIARRNLERLEHLKVAPQPRGERRRVSSSFFIEESGKTAVAALEALAGALVLAGVSAGEPVGLMRRGDGLGVYDGTGRYLGQVPPALGRRAARLMDGGNQYQGAVFSVDGTHVTVLLREAYQHPSQRNIPSFPSEEHPVAAAGVVETTSPRVETSHSADQWLSESWDEDVATEEPAIAEAPTLVLDDEMLPAGLRDEED